MWGKLTVSHSWRSFLEYLNLAANLFVGEIPIELYNAILLSLLVGGNQLTGSIRTEIGRMTNLTQYGVGSSKMAHTIPSQLFTLSNLEVLELNDSGFSGTLSEADFGVLTHLKVLWLQNNKFTGPIPITAFENMMNLEELNLYGNPGVTGAISATLCGSRGLGPATISILKVDCTVSCSCCDKCN